MTAPDVATPVYLVQGEDPGLLSQALSALIGELSEGDGGLSAIEEYGEAGKTESRRDEASPLGPVLEACRTLPFLAPRRIVVLRDTTVLDSAQVKEVIAYLADPLDTTTLVLVHPGKSAPAALVKSVRAHGVVIDAVPASATKARQAWFAEQLDAAPVRLTREAANLLANHVGEDLARVDGILGSLFAAFGNSTTISAEDLEPFLGALGGVAPWDLTDAIDAGDTAKAVTTLHRMIEGGERHPLQLMATLHRHYGAMLRLDGRTSVDEKLACELTGMAPYPAKKALNQARKLGHARLARAIGLLAAADIDLRGELGWPGEVVLEILVARLARLPRDRSSPARVGALQR